MAVMTHRTTLALDELTVGRIRRLAGLWAVSQSEAVRRAVQQAERRADDERRAPLDRLEGYHRAGGLDRHAADAYLGEVDADRSKWRGGE
jgi:hypothetical protein